MATASGNILANFAGRALTMLMGVAFVPVYLKLLGVEAYGLIGFYTALQGVLVIADLGFSWTIARELAKGSRHSDGELRVASLVRTIEVIYWIICISVGVLIVTAGGHLSDHWRSSAGLSPQTIHNAIQLMGLVLAVQMPAMFYQGGLNGLSRQITVNVIISIVATLRWAGAALVLWLIAPTIEAFFIWQIVVATISTAVSAWALWRLVPTEHVGARFDLGLMSDIWRFTLTVSGSALAGIMVTQIDKLVLSKLVSLEQFSYYSLATLISSLLYAIIGPIGIALYPGLSRLHAQNDNEKLAALYHNGSQLLAIALIPAALVIIFFSHDLLLFWTGDAVTATNTSLLASLLTLGSLIYCLSGMGNHLLIAAGWPGLSMAGNLILGFVAIPTLLIFVPRYGATAAAVAWIGTGSLYTLAVIPIMHQRLLRGHLMSWFLADTLIPLLVAFAVVAGARILMPKTDSTLMRMFSLGLVWIVAVLCVGLVLPEVRRNVCRFMPLLSGDSLRGNRRSS